MPQTPSDGIYFIARLPEGWQLCTFRFDEFDELSVPDFWIEVLGSTIRVWLHHFKLTDSKHYEDHHAMIEDVLPQLVAGYDLFPRGQVIQPKRRGARWTIQFGSEFTKAMGLKRRDIEEAFGIVGRAKW